MTEQDMTLLTIMKNIGIGVCFVTGFVTIAVVCGDIVMRSFISMCKWVAERTK